MRADTIELTTPDGPMPVYEAVPDGEARGGVLVLQDAFGVTPYLEYVCRRFAALGWHALGPHLFHRTGAVVIPFDDFPATKEHVPAMTAEGILADADACLAHLRSAGVEPSRAAALGFCMGGTLAFFLGSERPIATAVTYYGSLASNAWEGVTPALESSSALAVPWLGLFGDVDEMIPVEQVERLRALLAGVPVPTEIVRYPDANHAFHRDATPDWYHQPSAEDAWARTIDWLERYVPRA